MTDEKPDPPTTAGERVLARARRFNAPQPWAKMTRRIHIVLAVALVLVLAGIFYFLTRLPPPVVGSYVLDPEGSWPFVEAHLRATNKALPPEELDYTLDVRHAMLRGYAPSFSIDGDGTFVFFGAWDTQAPVSMPLSLRGTWEFEGSMLALTVTRSGGFDVEGSEVILLAYENDTLQGRIGDCEMVWKKVIPRAEPAEPAEPEESPTPAPPPDEG